MKHQAITLVKFSALSKRLSLPRCWTIGVLESLWTFACCNARDGDLSRFSALEIAGWIEWPGDENELIEALVETRWLDRDGDSLSIHDWGSIVRDYRIAKFSRDEEITHHEWTRLRAAVISRDGRVCSYCFKSVDDRGGLHVDHKIPLSRGGRSTMENLVVACRTCNLQKSSRTDTEWSRN